MNSIDKIIEQIQNTVVDHTKNSIEYRLTKTKNNYVLHIYNPLSENVGLYNYNKNFFSKFINALFERDFGNKENGCFNHEHEDGGYKYSLDDSALLNTYLNIDATFILINTELEPLCSFSISGDTIYNVCTNFFHRKRGYMSLLLDHTLKLIQLKKINNIDYESLKLTIRKINPIKDKLISYYQSYGFRINNDIGEYIYMNIK